MSFSSTEAKNRQFRKISARDEMQQLKGHLKDRRFTTLAFDLFENVNQNLKWLLHSTAFTNFRGTMSTVLFSKVHVKTSSSRQRTSSVCHCSS